jgi:hypothetical protein
MRTALTKTELARNKITKALAKKEGRLPAKKPDRIEAGQAGNGPLSGIRESGHKPDRAAQRDQCRATSKNHCNRDPGNRFGNSSVYFPNGPESRNPFVRLPSSGEEKPEYQ